MSIHDLEPGARDTSPPARRPIERREAEAARGPADGRRGRMDAAAVLHLQRAVGNANVARLVGAGEEEEGHSPVKDVVGSGSGHALEAPFREEMESSFGQDFGDVRIHTDSKASESAKAVNAHAYTSGADVVFQSGMYSPGSESGKRMLAHELTHVVQQKAGPVSGTPAGGGIMLSDPGDTFEREADRTAEKVVSGSGPVLVGNSGGEGGPGVQRQEDEEVQGSFIQRDEAEEDSVQGFFVQRQEGEEEESQEG